MRDDQMGALLRALDHDREPDPAFADALFERLNVVARNEPRVRLHLEHLQHLTRLQMAGKLVLNGPILSEHDIVGVSVYAAGLAEARALAEADPKVRAGYLTVEALPWMAVASEAAEPPSPAG